MIGCGLWARRVNNSTKGVQDDVWPHTGPMCVVVLTLVTGEESRDTAKMNITTFIFYQKTVWRLIIILCFE